jgi:hypothetical protein
MIYRFPLPFVAPPFRVPRSSVVGLRIRFPSRGQQARKPRDQYGFIVPGYMTGAGVSLLAQLYRLGGLETAPTMRSQQGEAANVKVRNGTHTYTMDNNVH